MRARLRDPAQRATLRAEQRTDIEASHPDLAETLDIDAAQEQELIELLTDQRLEQLDRFYNSSSAPSPRPDVWQGQMADQAAQHTRHIEALRALLGHEKLERYQHYEKTLAERRQVADLDARLEPALKLSAAQKEQLIALWQTHNRQVLEEHRGFSHPTRLTGSSGTLPSREELQRLSQLQTIASNEAMWRRRSQADATLRKEAASFLSATQLAVLEQMQSDESDELKRWIEQARLQAGLMPGIPAEPEQSAVPMRQRVDGDVKVSIRLAVNAESTQFTQVVRNGQSVSFAAAGGLLVEVTPILYSDDVFDLRMAYYEQGEADKRLIGEMGQMGTWTPGLTASPPQHGGSAATVIAGSKGYAIEVSSHVEPM